VLLAAMLAVLRRPSMRRTDGRAFLLALAGWCLVRLVVATTWRDPVAVGPLRAEQVIDLIVLVAAATSAVVVARRPAVSPGQPAA